jgi:hypothetical protein
MELLRGGGSVKSKLSGEFPLAWPGVL